MEPAREQLADAIRQTSFKKPSCPIYQNVMAQPTQDSEVIKENLIAQLTAQSDGHKLFEQCVMRSNSPECGPGKVLQGLVRKIDSGTSSSCHWLRN